MFMFRADNRSPQELTEVTVQVDGHALEMEVDTGSAGSLVSKDTFQRVWHSQSLQKSMVNLSTYSGEAVRVLCELKVEVQYGDQVDTLPLLVVEGDGPSLCG